MASKAVTTVAVNALKEIATFMIEFAMHKIKMINIEQKEVDKAERLLKSATFDRYKEKWTTRLASFKETNAERVVDAMTREYKWNEGFAHGLKDAILVQLQDRRSDNCFEIIKDGENSFSVYFVMMTKIDETVHLGLAYGTTQFKLSPVLQPCYETQPFLWFFKREVQIGSVKQERQINPKEKAVLEKYFQQMALKRFLEEVPHNPIRATAESQDDSTS